MPINRQTVFVLGAGASMPNGFPSGEKLVELVGRTNYEDRNIYDAAGFSTEDLEVFQTTLLRSSIGSIDRFLYTHPEFEKIGKFSIALNISHFEASIRLLRRYDLPDTSFPQGNPDCHLKWYNYLFERKIDASTDDESIENLKKLSFVTFNYDRSLEEFFWNRFVYGEGLSPDEAKYVLSHLNIIHVHGQIGRLDWQTERSEVLQPFIECRDPEQLRKMSEGIKIIHEDLDETPDFCKARDIIRQSERLFFLGFGWHPENMRRLEIDSVNLKKLVHEKSMHISGTFYGWSDEEISEFQTFNKKITPRTQDCLTFLRRSKEFLRENNPD